MMHGTARGRLAAVVMVTAGLAVAASAPAAAQLAPEEERIAAHVEEHADEGIALLERIVEINSGTMNPEGVRAVADALAPHFEELGFTTRWVELPDSLERSGHLVAERIADGDDAADASPSLLLIGHLDTVFERGSPFQEFERLDSTTATGPGVNDMKGGNVVILQALRALDAAGALEDATIRVVFTGDEEDPGRPLSVARRALIEAAEASDVALGFETASRDEDNEYAVIARRSSSAWILRTEGQRAHSSGVFSGSTGAGAIFEAARILDGFYEELRGEENLTFSPGVILGGSEVEYDDENHEGSASGKTNVVPASAVVHGDIRALSEEQLSRTRERMRGIVSDHRPETAAEITFEDGYPPMPPTEGNRALLAVYDEVSRDLGYPPVLPFDPGGRGAADISFVAEYVDGLDGLGPYGRGAHGTDETVDLSSMPKATKRAALLMYRLLEE